MKNIFLLTMLLLLATVPYALAQSGQAESATISMTSMPPVAPVLSSLQNVFLYHQGVVSWGATTHTLSYRLQFSNSESFSSLEIDDTGITGTSHEVLLSSSGATYYVRVSAANAAGAGSYSDSKSFVTPAFTFIDVGDNSAPAVADIDGDGLLDLLIGEELGNINRYEQTSTNSMQFNLITAHFNSIDIGESSAPALVDLDGDGLLDLLIGKDTGVLVHWEQNSDRSDTFTKISSKFSDIDAGAFSKPTFTDLDHDGLLDLLIGERYGKIRHYEQSTALSTVFTLRDEDLSALDVGAYSAPAVCNYTFDAELEMLIGRDSGVYPYYKQSSSSATWFFNQSDNFYNIDVGSRSTITITDLNGDNTIDFLMGEADGVINLLIGETGYINSSCMTTVAAASVTSTSAVLGGAVTDDNDVPVVRRGVCYSTTSPPTLSNSQEPNGSGTGSFSETVSGLSAGTTYYVRAFCSSCMGTFYGSVESFTTSSVQLSVKVFLEGPYNAAADEMTRAINASIPLTSPYSEDARAIASIPANITDWVLVQLRSTVDGSAVASISALLHKDGRIVADDGTTGYIELSASAGDYFIVIKHRNHLAIMSDDTHTLAVGSSTLYDFTTGTPNALVKYEGGEAALLETGINGMFCGDADGSGTVDANDRSDAWNNRNTSGYLTSDCCLSGTCDANSRSATWNNRNKSTNVP